MRQPAACVFPSLNRSIRKFFRRFPTTLEWIRFRKYARRMRKLTEPGNLYALSLEVLSVLQFFAVNERLFPHLITLELYDATEIKFI